MANMWTCGCGALNRSKVSACEYCGEDRVVGKASPAAAIGHVCQDCRGAVNLRDGAIVVDGQYLCAECQWGRMRRGATRASERCGVEGCDKTIREHMAELPALLAKMTAWKG